MCRGKKSRQPCWKGRAHFERSIKLPHDGWDQEVSLEPPDHGGLQKHDASRLRSALSMESGSVVASAETLAGLLQRSFPRLATCSWILP